MAMQLLSYTAMGLHSYRTIHALLHCYGLHSYKAAHAVTGLHSYWAAQLQAIPTYRAAQVWGCRGTGLHSYEAAQIRGCVGTRLRRGYGFAGAAQVLGYNTCEAAQVWGCTGTGLHRYLRGYTAGGYSAGPTQPKINLYSMRKILWPVPDTCTALIQLCGFSVQEKLAVQLKHTGMLQACAFSSVPGMYFFGSGTSMLQFRIQE